MQIDMGGILWGVFILYMVVALGVALPYILSVLYDWVIHIWEVLNGYEPGPGENEDI